MDIEYLFEPYDKLVRAADQSFANMVQEFPDRVRCEPGCADCCHALFGLFLIEAVFMKRDFDQLDEDVRTAALQRGEEADRALEKLEETLRTFKDDPQMISYSMARARIRCPLLNDDDACILYPYRPITCRVYGIPTRVRGVPRVCGRSGFENDPTYPLFDLDDVHRELHQLSRELLERAGGKDPERATLLVSVSKAIQTPVEALITEIEKGPGAER